MFARLVLASMLLAVTVFCTADVKFALAATSGIAGDDVKTPPKEKPDFTKAGYVFVKEIAGEVVSADEKKVKIKVSIPAGKPAPKARPNVLTAMKEIEYEFVPDLSLVRFENKSLLPKKMDAKGKRLDYTQKELDKLKLPVGVTGYAATIADLAPRTIVNLQLVVEKSLLNKATEDDLRIKYAIIQQVAATADKKGDLVSEFIKLQGEWHLNSIETASPASPGGSKKTEYKNAKAMVLTIRNDQWALAFGPDLVKDEQFLASFGPARGNVNIASIFLDPLANPKQMELHNPRGPVIWSGLYRLEDENTLTICRPMKLGGKKPTEFKISPDAILWEWRKANSTADDKKDGKKKD